MPPETFRNVQDSSSMTSNMKLQSSKNMRGATIDDARVRVQGNWITTNQGAAATLVERQEPNRWYSAIDEVMSFGNGDIELASQECRPSPAPTALLDRWVCVGSARVRRLEGTGHLGCQGIGTRDQRQRRGVRLGEGWNWVRVALPARAISRPKPDRGDI